MDTLRVYLVVTVVAILAALTLSGCASAPEVRPIVVPQERTQIQRPELPIERLTQAATAAEVFQAYRESLLICIGYAKQLEATNK